jgi:hypothetical protein
VPAFSAENPIFLNVERIICPIRHIVPPVRKA